MRRFLNMFSYECKVAFYGCYSCAWVGILPLLSQNREPNPIGDRFMGLWHNQNRAPDDPEASGGVFCGQVLALHPLSAVVLTSPEHLTVIGDWIGHPDYESIVATGQIAECSEYWDFVATILTAAHEYNHSKRRWEESRGQHTEVNADIVAQHSRDDAIASAAVLFDDFAAARGLVCSECSTSLSYARHESQGGEEPIVTAYFRCKSCSNETAIEISRSDLEG